MTLLIGGEKIKSPCPQPFLSLDFFDNELKNKFIINNTMVKAWKEKVVIPTYEVGKPEKNPIFLEKRVYQGSSGVFILIL